MTVLTKTLEEDAVVDVINVEDAWEVTIVQDEHRRGVELEYSAFLEEYLMVHSDGSALEVGFKQRLNLPSATVKHATVYVPSLRELYLKEAVSAVIQGSFVGDRLLVELDDAATLCGGSFTGELQMALDGASVVGDFSAEGTKVNLSLEGASVFKGILTATEKLDIHVVDASRMTTYGGYAPLASVNVESASFLNMTQTEVGEMHINLSSAAEASVKATTLLEGSVKDASTLYFEGQPQLQLDSDESSSVHPL